MQVKTKGFKGSIFVSLGAAQRSKFLAQGARVGVAIFLGNLVNINTSTSVAQPDAEVMQEEQTIRRSVTAVCSYGKSDQLLSFPLRPLRCSVLSVSARKEQTVPAKFYAGGN